MQDSARGARLTTIDLDAASKILLLEALSRIWDEPRKLSLLPNPYLTCGLYFQFYGRHTTCTIGTGTVCWAPFKEEIKECTDSLQRLRSKNAAPKLHSLKIGACP